MKPRAAIMLFVFLMSFAAILRGPTIVRGEPAVASRKQYKYDARKVEASIELGERVAGFIRSTYGPERADRMLEDVARRATRGSQPSRSGSQPSRPIDPVIIDLVEEDLADSPLDDDPTTVLPYGFWRRFMTEDMEIEFSRKKRMQLSRSLTFYVLRKQEGAETISAMRGLRDRGSCRSNGGSLNARKAGGLGFQLLQFFVDYLQRLQCRSDSCMLMKKAKELSAELLHSGWTKKELPQLDGNAGHQWFRRWRQMYGISRKVTGMKLKVPWAKVKKRIGVFLGNMYRLRAFWEICHPNTPMRFISLDQKPSWYNNAGHTGTFAVSGGSQPSVREDFNKTRERYSILTAVPNFGHTGDLDQPPKVAILVKGKPGGKIIRDLRKSRRLKPWMLVQAQVNGSYRSEDMVEALDFMLPSASNSTESIVVLLDWYSGHLTEEVARLVRSKGHVLCFHGGGCTPFTQINDTHLHAVLARLLIQIENEWAFVERDRLVSLGKNKTPKMTRDEMLSIVQNAWLSIDHARVAEKGYKQTGPMMPLRGPVAPEDVFKDLLRAMEEIEPSPSPLEVGMTLRNKAVEFVEEGFIAGKWTVWADAYKLIEEQDGVGEALEEGLEAFREEPDEDPDAELPETDDDDDDADDDQPGGGSGGLSAKAADADDGSEDGSQPSLSDDSDDDHGDDELDESAGGIADIGGAEAAHSEAAKDAEDAEAAKSARSLQVAGARQVMFDEAIRTRNDAMLRQMRQQMRGETQKQKDAGTEIGMLLKKRVQENREADMKRRRQDLEQEWLAAKNLEKLKTLRANAEQAKEEARLAALRQALENRRDLQNRRYEELVEKTFQRWLQTQYPTQLARRIISFWRKMTVPTRKTFEGHITKALKERTFQRQVYVKDLWTADRSLTLDWSRTESWTGGRCSVRCSLMFQEMLDEVAPKSMFDHDPVETLYKLFLACVPSARRVFTDSYGALRILHMNDYVLEKAFVYGIVALSKWLGEERYPCGVYGRWPPKMPADLIPKLSTPMQAPLLVGHPDDENLPPRLRIGSPAASSNNS